MPKNAQTNSRLKLLQLAIILIPFSYQPRIFFSSLQGLSLELSFVQIAASLFILFSIKGVLKNYKKILSLWPVKLLGLFVIFNWISIIWSADAPRTVVLSTYWTFLFAIVISIIALFIDRKIKQKDITNPLMIGAVVGALFGTWQFFGVTIGLDPSVTLIQEAYNAELFGFGRIQAFALEPQFYANALLAPIFYLSWRLLFSKWQTYHIVLLSWFFIVFLLTVSRGALVGFVLGLILLLGFYAYQQDIKDKLNKLLRYIGILLISFVAVLGIVFVSGEIQGGIHSGTKSVEVFVDHMSHGVIDIQIASGPNGEEVDGLVEASTTGRFFMVGRAFDIVSDSPERYIIGIGAGSFGPVFETTFKNVDRINHVINNQYVEFFTELGIIGLALFISFIVTFARTIWLKTKPYTYMLLAILVSYLLQYFFFSLQTNVIHIWLFIGVVLGMGVMSKSKKKAT